MTETSPDKLFMDLQNGSQSALDALYRQIGPSLLRYLRSIQCRQPEDVLQETFLALFKQSAKLRPDTTIQAWLFKVARNQAFKGHSRLKMVPIEDSNTPKHTPNPDQAIAVQTAFQTLNEPFRSTLALFHWEGLSLEEISCIMAIPVNTVKTRLYRARQLLKKKLNPSGENPGARNPQERSKPMRISQDGGLKAFRNAWVSMISQTLQAVQLVFQNKVSIPGKGALKNLWNKQRFEQIVGDEPHSNPLKWCPS